MDLSSNIVKFVYNGIKKDNPLTKDIDNNGVNINENAKKITQTTIEKISEKTDNKEENVKLQSEKKVEVIFSDIEQHKNKQAELLLNNIRKNIYLFEQAETENEPYIIFQNNQKIEFDDDFILELENNYSINGIMINCEMQVEKTEEPKLYEINILIPLCITDIYSKNQFSIVSGKNEKTNINMDDNITVSKDAYFSAIEQQNLLNKIL